MLQIDSNLAGVVISALLFTMVAVVVGFVVFARHRAREMRYQTIRTALEKGQPLPPELLRDAEPRSRAGRTDLQRGVLLLFLGAGISAFLYVKQKSGWGVGLILVALGLGYVVSHLVGGRRQPEIPPSP